MLPVTKSVTEEPVTAKDCSLRFVVETEPWLRVFLRNLADLFALPLHKCDSQQLRLNTGRTPRVTGRSPKIFL